MKPDKKKIKIRNTQISQLYTSGKSMNSIARQMKVDHKTVRNALKKHNLYKKKIFVNYLSPTAIKLRNIEIRQLYRNGASIKSIAKKFHRDWKAIKYVLVKARLYRKKIIQLSSEEKEIRRQEIFQLYRQGMSIHKISHSLNMWRPSVMGILRRAGLR